MPTILITGISGFVAGHFTHYLACHKKEFIIHGISRSQPKWPFLPNPKKTLDQVVFHQIDLLDMDATRDAVRRIAPDYVLHLASQSSVADSWKEPRESFLNNTNIFLNIIESIRGENHACRILSVGSSEQYGIVEPEELPLKENSRTQPANPYAVARLSQEHLALLYSQAFKLNICCTRSFNHMGAGQSERFVVSSIVKQFVNIKYKNEAKIIRIGDGDIIRDFIDISDVITAYDTLLERGKRGVIYNVCTGKGRKICDIIQRVSEICDIRVEVEQDEWLLRPRDNPIIIGSYDLLEKNLGWRPCVNLESSLKSMVDYWTSQVVRN